MPVFFAVSGFLVSLSYEHAPDALTYARNRALRIYPALWVCFLLTVLSVQLLYPRMAPGEWLPWVACQLTVCQFNAPASLQGFGTDNPNGSLWTIPVELQFYALLPLLYTALGLDRRQRNGLLLGLLTVFVAIYQWYLWLRATPPWSTTLLVWWLQLSILPHLYMFLIGLLVQRNFGRLAPLFRGTAPYWLVAYLVSCFGFTALGLPVGGNTPNVASGLVLAGLVFSAAHTAPTLAARVLGRHDLSYGLYIYHMPVANALLRLGWAARRSHCRWS